MLNPTDENNTIQMINHAIQMETFTIHMKKIIARLGMP